MNIGGFKMALITCEECQKEISDTVYTCPHCGYLLKEQDDIQKVELTSIKVPMGEKKKKKIFITGILLIVLLISSILGYKVYQQNQIEKLNQEKEKLSQEYLSEVVSVTKSMINSAETAESVLNLTHKVWYNAIYEEYDDETNEYTRKPVVGYYDFNEALSNLNKDTSFKDKKEKIKNDQTSISNTMKELQNPPSEHQKIYEMTLELYSSYQKLTDLAISPTGSLSTFSQTKNNAISDLVSLYNQLQVLLPQ